MTTTRKTKARAVLWVIVDREGLWDWVYYNRRVGRSRCRDLNRTRGRGSPPYTLRQYRIVERKK